MVMVSKMLYATDLSPYSKTVAEYARDLKKLGVEEVGILYVIDTIRFEGASGGFDISAYVAKELEKAREEYPKLAATFESAGIKVKTIEPPAGDPAAQILKYSKDYDFIGVASHGYGVTRGILMGSTSEIVVKRAKKPVLVFKFAFKDLSGKLQDIVTRTSVEDVVFGGPLSFVKCHECLFQRNLVAYDFSELAEAALEYAIYATKKFDGEIHVVYVDGKRSLSEVESKLKGLNYTLHERKGSVTEEIIKVKNHVDATSIFIGAHRGKGWKAIVGSVTEYVVRHSSVPVFVIRK